MSSSSLFPPNNPANINPRLVPIISPTPIQINASMFIPSLRCQYCPAYSFDIASVIKDICSTLHRNRYANHISSRMSFSFVLCNDSQASAPFMIFCELYYVIYAHSSLPSASITVGLASTIGLMSPENIAPFQIRTNSSASISRPCGVGISTSGHFGCLLEYLSAYPFHSPHRPVSTPQSMHLSGISMPLMITLMSPPFKRNAELSTGYF